MPQQQLPVSKNHQRIKREVRCKSGAIPVAVSVVNGEHLQMLKDYHCPPQADGKVSAKRKPEDLPSHHIELSGEKARMMSTAGDNSFLLFFHESSSLDIFKLFKSKDGHEKNYLHAGCADIIAKHFCAS
jgi:hypothetical protein